MEEEGNEENNVRFLGGGDGGGGGETRLIDGNEVDLEPPPWSLIDDGGGEIRWVGGCEVDSKSPPWSLVGDVEIIEWLGSVRRRLKKPKRVESFDVEAMEIADSS
ncbi:potassium transporter 12 isoform X1 [Olea europaea subsp. europaea]|uniref:Potassium transporter 12 isoform X1 n=1 Tax=Olea europaea subsp. europaea TaxID=158383 RepID=A0A8S0UBE1_OLEEU|nr:potassium transporter 12 isoform X1 [Olea europaea subsp. europaea]